VSPRNWRSLEANFPQHGISGDLLPPRTLRLGIYRKPDFEGSTRNHFVQIEEEFTYSETTKTLYLPALKHWRDPEEKTLDLLLWA
jgi:hypothetical protein